MPSNVERMKSRSSAGGPTIACSLWGLGPRCPRLCDRRVLVGPAPRQPNELSSGRRRRLVFEEASHQVAAPRTPDEPLLESASCPRVEPEDNVDPRDVVGSE